GHDGPVTVGLMIDTHRLPAPQRVAAARGLTTATKPTPRTKQAGPSTAPGVETRRPADGRFFE
ncbi:MAG: hypothetical protein V3U29_03420, partial [Phycisphaeraceae bacterium]